MEQQEVRNFTEQLSKVSSGIHHFLDKLEKQLIPNDQAPQAAQQSQPQWNMISAKEELRKLYISLDTLLKQANTAGLSEIDLFAVLSSSTTTASTTTTSTSLLSSPQPSSPPLPSDNSQATTALQLLQSDLLATQRCSACALRSFSDTINSQHSDLAPPQSHSF